jgi:bacillithiol synthase
MSATISDMKPDTLPDIQHISPAQHEGFGVNSIFAAIHSNNIPSTLPLFEPDSSEISEKRIISNRALDYLDSYNQNIGKPLSESVKTRLKNGAQLVIAGQQPGVMLGPMYTFWKYLTAVNLAADVSKKTEVDLIPAFWIASDDHDIHEVNRVVINGKTFTAQPDFPAVRGHLRPVGMVSLQKHRESLLSFLKMQLSGKPYYKWLEEIVASCDFTSYSTFFATLAAALFKNMHECVFIDALTLKSLTGAFLSNAIKKHAELEHALQNGAEILRSNGYSPQLYDCGIFEIANGHARLKCRFENNRMIYSDGVLSIEDAAEFVRTHSERFSAGAALRPILQDSLFSVAITVCGPTEILYQWQIDPLYDILDIKRSLLYPRISATVFPSVCQRHLKKIHDISRVLQSADEASSALKQYPNDAPPADDLETLNASKDSLINQMRSIHDTDPLMLDKAVRAIDHHIGKISKNVLKKRCESLDSDLKRIRHLHKIAFINGKPQERVMNLCEILVEEGPEWLERIFETVSPFETAHRIISVSSTDMRRTQNDD